MDNSVGQASFSSCTKYLLVALMVYSSVALLIEQYWKGVLSRILPNWIPIALFGSIIYECFILVPAMVRYWNDPVTQMKNPDLTEFVLREAVTLRSVLILDWVITLSATALVYYAGSIIKLIKYWRNRPQVSLGTIDK